MFQPVKSLALLALFAALSLAQLAQGPVQVYGHLKACKYNGQGRICGSVQEYDNYPVQLRGVSFGWSHYQESRAFFNEAAANAMIDGWKAEIVRAPLAMEGGSNNDYIFAGTANRNRVKTIVDAAIAKDAYVIIDFHSHNAHNEFSYAKTFFEQMAQEYGNKPHVIFEIYNEPRPSDGGTWANVKSYADQIIPVIRQYSNNLILVGTPFWCQNVNDALAAPINDPNVAYVFHFYSKSHSVSSFQGKITPVLNAGYSVFVSEYGTTTADGGQGANVNSHDAAGTDAWHAFMDANGISSAAWQVNNRNEGSSYFLSSFQQSPANFTNTSLMTASGQYIYSKLIAYSDPSRAWWRAREPLLDTNPIKVSQVLQLQKGAVLEVFNANGSFVRKIKYDGGNYSAQLSDLPKGLYLVKASDGSLKQTVKVAVK